MFQTIIQNINVFQREKAIIIKERKNNMYGLTSYYIAKIFSEIPNNIIGPIIFGTLVYFIGGLNTEGVRFFVFQGIVLLVVTCSVYVGLTISAISSGSAVAGNVVNLVGAVLFLFAGMFIKIQSIPKILKWLASLSYIRWAFQALVINEFGDTIYEIQPDDDIFVPNGYVAIKSLGFEQNTLK